MFQASRGLHALGHGRLRARFRATTLAWAPLAAVCGFSACEPTLVVGRWHGTGGGEGGLAGQDGAGLAGQGGAEAGGPGGAAAGQGSCDEGAAGSPATTDPLPVPWTTGFEDGFCDFQRRGLCFADGDATYELVDSPVRSGNSAAAFTINSTSGYQSRCLIQGELPEAAYYGAWYYVPALSTNNSVWNLLHFQGGDPSAQHGLWDVSLRNGSDGNLEAYVYDFLHGMNHFGVDPPPVPIGAWFHLEFYLRRAADETGEIALYQDGQLVVEATGLVTDDSNWGQWYVGNIANSLSPPQSTLYVDDVTLGTSR